MAISSINNNVALFPKKNATPQKSANVAASSKSAIGNADGDTLKLSGSSQNAASKTVTYTQPKPITSSNPSVKTDSVIKK